MGYSSWWGVRNRSPVCKISTEIFHQKRVCEISSYYTGKTLLGLQKVQILRLQVRLSAEVHGSCRSLGNNCLDDNHLFFTSRRDVAMGGCWPAGRQTLWERATNNEVWLVHYVLSWTPDPSALKWEGLLTKQLFVRHLCVYFLFMSCDKIFSLSDFTCWKQ